MTSETRIFSIIDIFSDSFEKLFNNFWPLCKYMLYPVLGQILGLIISVVPSFVVATLAATLDMDVIVMLSIIILGAIIGLPLFCHAFWKYIIRSASLCVISKDLILNNQLIDFKLAEEQITKRTGAYIALLLIVSLIYLVALIPMFLPLAFLPTVEKFSTQAMLQIMLFIFFAMAVGIVLIYFITLRLAVNIPAFALNSDLAAGGALKLSIELTKNKMGKTFLFILAFAILQGFDNAINSIPFVQIITTPIIMIIMTPLSYLLTTHWYLRLEAEKNMSIN